MRPVRTKRPTARTHLENPSRALLATAALTLLLVTSGCPAGVLARRAALFIGDVALKTLIGLEIEEAARGLLAWIDDELGEAGPVGEPEALDLRVELTGYAREDLMRVRPYFEAIQAHGSGPRPCMTAQLHLSSAQMKPAGVTSRRGRERPIQVQQAR